MRSETLRALNERFGEDPMRNELLALRASAASAHAVRAALRAMTPEEREAWFDEATAELCVHCWYETGGRPCYCMADD